MRVLVLPYNPQWPQQFLAIKSSLEGIFDTYNAGHIHKPSVTYTSIEHVGSTSIPLMPAKPRIDIDVIIPTAQDLQPLIEALTFSGQYEYRGDLGIPERWAFRYLLETSEGSSNDDTVEQTSRNVYVTVEGCLQLRNHIAVRDICRNDEQVRQRYAEVKLALSQREWSSVDEYCEAKNDVMAWILAQGGMLESEISQIRGSNTRDKN